MRRAHQGKYERQMTRISDIFTKLVAHAEVQSRSRCPYRNMYDQCTSSFACRNRRGPRAAGEPPVCASEGKLDFRSAWETNVDSAGNHMGHHTSPTQPDMGESAHTTVQHDSGYVWYEDICCPSQKCKTLFDCADELDVRLPSSCARMGQCHECIINVSKGASSLCERTEHEAFLTGDYRLACQAAITDDQQDIAFSLLRRTPRILTTHTRRDIKLDPVVSRQGNNVCYGDEVIDTYHGHIYGLAIDVGTTTVVAELVDLENGESVYVISFENPQRFGGSDVMHRISYDSGAFTGELHRALINTLNSEIRRMCSEINVSRREIYEVVAAGNATMRELFFNHDVHSIGQKPYKSQIESQYLSGQRDTTAITSMARELRIMINKNARVYGVPLIASHVGGDVVADLVAIDADAHDDIIMLVDVGTNTEVVIGNKDRMIAASCPAGPAFEGGVVEYGMPGCDGAIESIRYVDKRFECQTIGGGRPRGICGSGLIDLLAELCRHNLMSPEGVFTDGTQQIEIVPEEGITFSRRDASELAQAKAANFCGQAVLMRQFGVQPDQISKLYLAGGFANYVNSAAAVDIGFIAPVPHERIIKVGNAAAEGAREMLLSRKRRESIDRFAQSIEHIELETIPDFFEVFVDGCRFSPMQMPPALNA